MFILHKECHIPMVWRNIEASKKVFKLISLLFPFLTVAFGLWIHTERVNLSKIWCIFNSSQLRTKHLCYLSTASLIISIINNKQQKIWPEIINADSNSIYIYTINGSQVYCGICCKNIKTWYALNLFIRYKNVKSVVLL